VFRHRAGRLRAVDDVVGYTSDGESLGALSGQSHVVVRFGATPTRLDFLDTESSTHGNFAEVCAIT
jgi:hypothetical protein